MLLIHLFGSTKTYSASFCVCATSPSALPNQIAFESAMPTKIVMIILPACVVVSAQGSESDWKRAPALLIVSTIDRLARSTRNLLEIFCEGSRLDTG